MWREKPSHLPRALSFFPAPASFDTNRPLWSRRGTPVLKTLFGPFWCAPPLFFWNAYHAVGGRIVFKSIKPNQTNNLQPLKSSFISLTDLVILVSNLAGAESSSKDNNGYSTARTWRYFITIIERTECFGQSWDVVWYIYFLWLNII